MKSKTRENPLFNLFFNVVAPSIILIKFSSAETLGPIFGFVVALFFPLSYGIFDFFSRQKWNFFSGLGLFSVILTGGIGLLKLSPSVLAIKEAAIPFFIGLVIFFAEKRFHFAEKMILNDEVFDTEKIKTALKKNKSEKYFERKIRVASFLLAGSFFFSAILNFFLAKEIVKSPAGSPEFAAELGKMTALSYPVIVAPMMIFLIGILIFLFRALKTATGFGFLKLIREDR